ncbi:phosphatidate cytidylyltransferase [Glaciimonas sp. Gout2]|uniref:phosphatidate cytidylyltransferase n=2 Tax=Glaciimonas TaxID=1229970 RepID=UPI002AB49344|nr:MULTISPECIES: phosphatidate cytidylyltransferase [unclassified Glaciimonas]MDY7548848.1 phosphatidate cytidylyltransferase [Glaciimonas sp. CA11.2]MEB0012494.1 phosphatidate cytidylyltransferase [Glaciimonas sp. Cout2]MEB0082577.1 phosphatidate cytidylyltransferase [Glaciimonas sp. Gout2]
MLKTRVITALLLLAVLLPILYLNFFPAFAIVAVLFFAAAIWECARLFGVTGQRALACAAATMILLILVLVKGNGANLGSLFALCVALWCLRFTPSLGLGLPALNSVGNRIVGFTYAISIFGCFLAILGLFLHSPIYLLSVMAIVWVADIGAYFCGKAFGRRKLAPSISPGKSWEGAIGGWVFVLVIASLICVSPAAIPLADTFPVQLFLVWGWPGLFGVMTILVMASVIGDLFESLLKRRAGFKDSSQLLPGHGGVLDRIDALIPVLPLVALLGYWF